LFRHLTISTQSAEHYATCTIAIEKVAGALISNDMRPRILHQQLGAAITTAQQSGKQSFAMFDGSTPRETSRIVVVGDHRLIALIHIPINVSLMMIQNQHRPVFVSALHPSLNLLPRLQPRYRLFASIHVCAGIDRVLQHAEYGVVSRGQPDDLACFL